MCRVYTVFQVFMRVYTVSQVLMFRAYKFQVTILYILGLLH